MAEKIIKNGIQELREKTLKGFNTWYNDSVLTYALLPEGAALRLGFKFLNTGRILADSLIGRFGEQDEIIHPGPRSYDGSYTELTLECGGQNFLIQSAVIDAEQYVLVTPVRICRKAPILIVSAAVLWNKEGYAKREGDRLVVMCQGRKIKFFIDCADGDKTEKPVNTGFTGPYITAFLSKPLSISSARKISAAELKPIMEKQREEITGETRKYGELADCYNTMRTCLAWDTIYEPENDQICSTVSRLWNVNWGGYVLFCWDTYFSSMMAMFENRDWKNSGTKKPDCT